MDMMSRAIRLKSDIQALEAEKADLEKQLRALERDLMPKPIYGNLEVRCEEHQGRETLYLTTYLLNEGAKDVQLNLFGRVDGDWRENRHSVGYYRTEDGILTHEGGGWCLLKEPALCSDIEWEALKAGTVPDKFKKNMD